MDLYKFFIIIIPFGYSSSPFLSHPLFKLSFIFDHLPSAYLLVHNCETSRGSFVFSFVVTLIQWSIPFDPIIVLDAMTCL